MSTPVTPLAVRFWAKVDRRGPDECWPWVACRDRRGYGRLALTRSKATNAHRVAHLLMVGPIPEGYHVDHLCRNPWCVNPAHLEAVTPQENQRRGIKGILTTHCPHGHAYDERNTRLERHRRHSRDCRACGREYYHQRAVDPSFRAIRAERERERRARLREAA